MEGRGEMKPKSYFCVSVFVLLLLLCICFFKHHHHSLEVWKTMLTGAYTEWKAWGELLNHPLYSYILIFFPVKKLSIRQSKGELFWGECVQTLLSAHTVFLSRVCPLLPVSGEAEARMGVDIKPCHQSACILILVLPLADCVMPEGWLVPVYLNFKELYQL